MLVRLAWKNLGRDRLRSVLTIAAVAIATFAFVLLRTVVVSWETQSQGSSSYLITRQRVSFLMRLPARYVEEMRARPGVEAAAPMLWVGGRIPGREEEDLATVATDPAALLEVMRNRIDVDAAARDAWTKDRKGLLAGRKLAERMHWKVGDRFSIVSGFAGLEAPLELVVIGTYKSNTASIDEETGYFRLDYLDDALPATRKSQITLIATRIAPGVSPEAMPKQIDEYFETRESPTLTQDEAAFGRNFLGFLSSAIRAIQLISVILLALIGLIVGNSIAMSVRERTSEYGTLRAVGFSERTIFSMIVGESAVLCALGGLVGVGAAVPVINQVVGPIVEREAGALFASFTIAPSMVFSAITASAALGFLAGAIPAVNALRIKTIDALRSIG